MLLRLNKLYPFPSSIMDLNGTVLAETAWGNICLKFPCGFPDPEERPNLIKQFIPDYDFEQYPMYVYKCPHGMIDCTIPIIIDEKHLGNLFAGQIFLEKPEIEFFIEKAKQYSFDEVSYLEAIAKVPEWNAEQLVDYLGVLRSVIDVMVGMGSKKLREIADREQKYRTLALAENLPDFISRFDKKLAHVYVNRAVEKIHGMPASYFQGKTLEDLRMPPEVIGVWNENLAWTFENEKERTFEFAVQSDYSGHFFSSLLVPEFNPEGKINSVLSVTRDITEIKKSENNLRIQHDISIMLGQTSNLSLALNQLLEFVCQLDGIDCSGVYLVDQLSGEINLVAHKGISEQFKSQSIQFGPDSEIAGIINKGKPFFRTYSGILEDRNPVIIQEEMHSYAIIPVFQNHTAIACLNLASHFSNEIPESSRIVLESISSNLGGTIHRISTENLLKESEEKYRLAFRTSPDAINITTTDGVYLDVNEGFESMTGYSREEVIGVSSITLNLWAIPEDRNKLIDGLKKDGRVENLESVFRKKDGTFLTGLMSASLIRINNQMHTLSITRDITDRKKAEMELIAAKEKAEESNRLKTAFLANLSHELRTPMNGILGFAELLEDDLLTKEERHEYISLIGNSGQNLLDAITNIMDISKIDSQQIESKPKLFNVNQLLDELFAWFKSTKIKTEKAHLKIELEKQTGNSECSISSDPEKIRHIFSLLLDNAAKFTCEGFIRFGYSLTDQSIRFFVQDSGKGIAPEKQKFIFERFRQEDESLSRKYGGIGLGLAIAKGLVELMQGRIWVESGAGEGSLFCFEIPRQ